MEMHPEDLSCSSSNGITNGNGVVRTHAEPEECMNGEGGRSKYQVIINISPLEYGNVLLVPSPHLCRPQVIHAPFVHAYDAAANHFYFGGISSTLGPSNKCFEPYIPLFF